VRKEEDSHGFPLPNRNIRECQNGQFLTKVQKPMASLVSFWPFVKTRFPTQKLFGTGSRNTDQQWNGWLLGRRPTPVYEPLLHIPAPTNGIQHRPTVKRVLRGGQATPCIWASPALKVLKRTERHTPENNDQQWNGWWKARSWAYGRL